MSLTQTISSPTMTRVKQTTTTLVQPFISKPTTPTAAATTTTTTLPTDKPHYTWQDVSTHNTASSAWVINNNSVYDITQWFNKHPGGKQVLLLSAGRDVTDLMISYHPFSNEKAQATLQKYHIGYINTAKDLEYPQFKADTGFYRELRLEVHQYFKRNNLNPKDPRPGAWRLAVFLLLAAVCYYLLNVMHDSLHWSVHYSVALVFGVLQAMPLLHCMHDASHTAIGNTEAYWQGLGRLCMDLYCGASLTSWLNQHIIGHHIYTNVIGADPDLPLTKSGDIRRVAPVQHWASFYQFQYLYLCVLYGVLAIKFRIQDITETLWHQMNGNIRVNITWTEYVYQAVTKLFWAYWRIYLPLYVFNVPSTLFWTVFLLTEYMTGAYLTFNFQVSHVSPPMAFPHLLNDDSQSSDPCFTEDEWAVHQMKTTLDYAHDNPLVAMMCGALNYQVVHHLFPSVSQYHYPAIAPIVKRIATKYHVPYYVVDSFTEAFGLHMQHLKTLGFEGLHEH